MSEEQPLSLTPLSPSESDRRRELEGIIRRGLGVFHEVGSALLEMRISQLYRSTHATFDDYAEEIFDLSHSRAYQLMDSAEVMRNLLTDKKVGELPISESQTRPLAALPANQQAAAWEEAKSKAGDKPPTRTILQKIVDKIKGSSNKGASRGKKATSWTDDELKADGELFNALKSIAAIYGNDDTRALRDGTMGFTRADILALVKLGIDKMKEIQDLMFEKRWKPQECIKFLNQMPDEDSTNAEMQNWCLATKGKFLEANIGGFIHTVKLNRAPKRQP